MYPKLIVNGVDLTAMWLHERSNVQSLITKRIDTATLDIEDTTGSVDVQEQHEIILMNNAETERYFAGYIVGLDIAVEGGIKKIYKCRCQDYTVQLNDTIINEVYEDKTDQAIILEAFDEYLPDIDTAALEFDGVGDFVACGSDTSLAMTDRITMEVWAKAATIDNTRRYAVGKNYGRDGILIHETNNYWWGELYLDGVYSWVVSSTVADTDWHHLALTYDKDGGANNALLYLDGSIIGQATLTGQIDSAGGPWDIARRGGGAGYYFGGLVSSARLWNRELTAAEVLAASRRLWVDDTGLVMDLPMNEGTGSTTYDKTDNDNDGAITGATWSIPLVQEGTTLDRFICNRMTLREMLERLSAISGYDWYVDYDKKLHYFSIETNAAPFGLSSNPKGTTSYPFRMNSYSKDASKIINRVLVRGGTYLSPDTEFELAGNAQTTELLVPYALHKPTGESEVLVWKNDGDDTTPSWTALGVGVDYLEALGGAVDVLYNYTEKLLKFGTAPPNLKRAIKIEGRYNVPVLARVRSDSSYTEYNRWFDGLLTDKNIESAEMAKLRGKAILVEHAFAKEKGSATFTQDGITSGMYIYIVDATRGIAGDYLIHKVTTRFLGNQVAQYTIKFGAYNPDLVDLLLELKRASHETIGRRDDEVLNELLEISEEIELEETVTCTATGPKYYCSPAVGSHDDIIAGKWKVSA